jgi:hypothetical protein
MLRVYNVTDLSEYGPPRTCVVNGVSVHPGRSHPFDEINLPLNRQVRGMVPGTSGMVVVKGEDPLPSGIQEAYTKLRAQPTPEPAPEPVPVPEPKKKPVRVAREKPVKVEREEPDHSARDAWLKERTFSVLKEGYAAVVGRRYSGPRGQKKVLAALLRDADEQKLTSWVETTDG